MPWLRGCLWFNPDASCLHRAVIAGGDGAASSLLSFLYELRGLPKGTDNTYLLSALAVSRGPVLHKDSALVVLLLFFYFPLFDIATDGNEWWAAAGPDRDCIGCLSRDNLPMEHLTWQFLRRLLSNPTFTDRINMIRFNLDLSFI